MSSNVADPAAGYAPPSATAAVRTDVGRTLLALVRREFWEHRVLWIAPLVVAVLMALVAALGHGHVDLNGDVRGLGGPLSREKQVALFSIVQWALSIPLYIVLLFCATWYLLDCLYAERKDRSILFWKSLPVGDGLTVLAKLLTALVAAPLVVFVLAIAGHLVFFAIFKVRVALGSFPDVMAWSTWEWLRTEAVILLAWFFAALWYAPLAAALLLTSVWARPNPYVWASLLPVVALILERVAFGTHFLHNFIAYRLFGIWAILAFPHGHITATLEGLHPVGSLLRDLDLRGAFTDIDLWLGVAAAAAMVWGAARVRRYRDDT